MSQCIAICEEVHVKAKVKCLPCLLSDLYIELESLVELRYRQFGEFS